MNPVCGCRENPSPVLLLASPDSGAPSAPRPSGLSRSDILLCRDVGQLRQTLADGQWGLVILERAAAEAHPGLYEELLAKPGGPSVALLTTEQIANLSGGYLRRRGLQRF